MILMHDNFLIFVSYMSQACLPITPHTSYTMSGSQPCNWVEVYNNIKEMRKGRTAPVDKMGPRMAVDSEASEKVQRFQCLVCLILSSQTKDEVTYEAMMRLRENGLTVDNILNSTEETLAKVIYPVGFWRSKTQYLLGTCKILKEEYDSDIPDSVEKLCTLPGVGSKVAFLTMSLAWGRQEGIAVDTHVQRIAHRLGWVDNEEDTPEKTRVALQAWLPKDKWEEVNWLLVGFGQEICLPVNPLCGECLNKRLCPTGLKW